MPATGIKADIYMINGAFDPNTPLHAARSWVQNSLSMFYSLIVAQDLWRHPSRQRIQEEVCHVQPCRARRKLYFHFLRLLSFRGAQVAKSFILSLWKTDFHRPMVFLHPFSLQGFLRSRQSGARQIPPLPRQGELEALGLGSGRVPEKNRGGSLGGVGEEDIISG